MTLTSNVHTHCMFCDGANTPREMAEAALALGFTDLGFSSHSPAPFDPGCPGVADEVAYRAGIAALREEYAGRLAILCGMEQDYYAPVNPAEYDYLIGSNHFLPVRDGQYVAVDADLQRLTTARDEWYGGDVMAMLRAFYALSAENALRYPTDIVGHFDLVAKYNKDGVLFDEESPRYQSMALEALDTVATAIQGRGGMVEVNTGAIARGLRSKPYPAAFLLRHLAQRGTRVIVTSDSHATGTLACWFPQAVELLRGCGFGSMAMLRGGRFVDVKI